MTEPGEDEFRARLRRVEQDAAAARILAGGADRDVGELGREFRAFRDQNNRVLDAMREDLVDLRERVDQGFARVDDQFAQVDQNFLTVRGQLDRVAAFMQMLAARLPEGNGDDRPQS